MKLAAVILAAGIGIRMKSAIPKVLHPVLGRPMLGYVLDAVSGLSPERSVVVVGHGAEDVKEVFGTEDVSYAYQKEQLGTGHAANCARSELAKFKGTVLIINGDFPLVTSKSLKKLIRIHQTSGSELSVLTANVDDPSGYGRVVRDSNGDVDRIVEEKDAALEQRRISEINSGTYLVDSTVLWPLLKALKTKNKQGEYYLTDILEIARRRSLKVAGIVVPDSSEILGVNDRAQLSQIEHIMKTRVNGSLMKSGVTIIDPDATYISPDAHIGRDSIIYPGTHIYGRTNIGRNSTIGPHVWIEDAEIGSGVTVKASCYITNASISDEVTVGPFAHLRPDARILRGAKIGNFVEIKKSTVGTGSKVPHLSYVGDAVLGKGVNIGAGTITCNYDGFNKHETLISDDVFIGSDTMLVAPVKVGRGAVTGAGSTITKDVPEGALAISRARQTVIENWKKKPREGADKRKAGDKDKKQGPKTKGRKK